MAKYCRFGVVFLLATVLPPLGRGEDVYSWTGAAGDYLWSTAGNWLKNEGAADTCPQAGSSVVVQPTDAVAITNDIEGLSLVKLHVGVDGEQSQTFPTVTLVGTAVTLTGGDGSWRNYRVTDCYLPLSFTGFARAFAYAEMNFRGDLTLDKQFRFSGNKPMNFYGAINGPTAEFSSGNMNLTASIYGPMNVLCTRNGSGCNGHIYVYSTGNSWTDSFLYRYATFAGMVAGAWPETMVMRWAHDTLEATSDVNTTYALDADQTIDRIESAAPIMSSGALNDKHDKVQSMKNATLTLKASASATTYAKLLDKMSLTYDAKDSAFVQEFGDRIHTMSGALTVRNGTLRSIGTNAFASVTSVSVLSGATLEIASANASVLTFNAATSLLIDTDATCSLADSASASRAFDAAKLDVTIRKGGVLAVPSEATVTVRTLVYRGAPVAAGTYVAGPDVPWISGEGSVSVAAQPSGTYWKAAVSGSWGDSANWSDGVPTGSSTAYVLAEGDDYTVSLTADATLPASLSVENRGTGHAVVSLAAGLQAPSGSLVLNEGGRLDVVSGGSMTANVGASVSVNAGGEFRVSGGTVVLTNYQGSFTVAGTHSLSGLVAVTSGRLVVHPWHDDYRLKLREGGAFELFGGSLEGNVTPGWNTKSIIDFQGGTFRASGSATYDFYAKERTTLFSSGETLFEDSSVFTFRPTWRPRIAAADPDGVASFVFRDSAHWATTEDSITLGVKGYGKGLLRLASDATHGTANDDLAWTMLVGSNDGAKGELHVEDGLVKIGRPGLYIGSSSSKTDLSTGSEGLCRVTGGTLEVKGSLSRDYPGMPHGILVGYGANTAVTSGRPYVGHMEVSGGEVSTSLGWAVIGAGYGQGDWTQSGGTTHLDYTFGGMAIGLAGGLGSLTISGGTFSVKRSAYVGGCWPTDILNGQYYVVDGNYPIGRHDGVGTLTVSGGRYEQDAGATLYVGNNGAGVVKMQGSDGALAVDYLVCSNAVVDAGLPTEATTSSELAFILDANGVSPMTVSQKATLTPGTTVRVDFSDYAGAGRLVKLIACPQVVADLNALVVRFEDRVGKRAETAKLVLRADGLYAKIVNIGLTVIVR